MAIIDRVALPIIISGTGPAGLLLAHSLLRSTTPLPFRLFEKDATMDFRAQGYRFNIKPSGVKACKESLSPELFNLLRNTCADNPAATGGPPAVKRLDSSTGESLPFPDFFKGRGDGAKQKPDPEVAEMTADRTLLRRVLYQGLEKYTSFGKAVVGYEAEDTGVAVKFSDGSVEHGSLLVAADGSFSRTARQLSPDHKLLDTEMRMIFGKTFITPELYQAIEATGITKQEAIDQLSSLALLVETTTDHPAPMFFMYDPMRFGKRAEAEAVNRDVGQGIPPDYIYWAMSLRADRPEVAELDWSTKCAHAVLDFARRRTEKWTPALRAIVEHAAPEQTLPFRSGVVQPPLPDWRASGAMVTLIGDAAHAMPPTGGMGVTTALADAALLAKTLAEHGITQEALRVYEDEMKGYATKAVMGSLVGGKVLVSMRDVDELSPMKAWV